MEVVATAPDNDGDWGRAAAAIDDGWGGRDDVTEVRYLLGLASDVC